MDSIRVLVIGPRPGDLETVKSRLAARGVPYQCETSPGAAPAWDVVLVDGDAPGFSLADTTEKLRAGGILAPLVVLTSEPEELSAHHLWAGAYDVLHRPSLAGFGALLARLRRDTDARVQQTARERRMRQASKALLKLAQSPAFAGDHLERACEEITEAAAAGARVARVSLWLFDALAGGMRCADLFYAKDGAHSRGHFLAFKDHPAYFQSLREHQQLSVPEALSDARTADYAGRYLKPLGIGAMLDTAFSLRGAQAGVLCLEHLGGARQWTPEEQVFASGLAELVSLALETRERDAAERRASQSEGRFRELFERSKDSVIIYRVRADGALEAEDLNPALEALLGKPREAVLGKTPAEVLPPVGAQRLAVRHAEVLQRRAAVSYEHELPMPTGAVWFNTQLVPFFDEHGEVRHIAAIARDVTEHRRLSAQLADARKSEALARLASAVAHDFNNLLAAISGWAARCLAEADDPVQVREAAEQVLAATGRGRELTRQVLTFGKPVQEAPLHQPLAQCVQQTLKLLQPSLPKEVKTAVQLDEAVWVRANAGQLHQVLTNLVTNAVEAMGGAGELGITTSAVVLDVGFARMHPPLSAGRAARLSVTDTGRGMDEATLSRVFEPFFTTRSGGKGTGLGLAMSASIVQAHGGAIVAQSEPGRGSRFDVYLPLVAPPHEGRPRLMLVDDEPNVANTSARLLEELGYATRVYGDAAAAFAAFESEPFGFDLVLTDLAMPGLDGGGLTRKLHQVRPELPVVICSGRPLTGDELKAMGAQAALGKPWRPEEARSALGSVLTR